MRAPVGEKASPRRQSTKGNSMSASRGCKIGCVSWCFHSFAGGADPEEALDIIGDLGFEGTDLILLAREDIDGFWTEARIDGFRRQLERNRLELAQFVLFQPVVEGLTSPDREARERNVDYFEAGC